MNRTPATEVALELGHERAIEALAAEPRVAAVEPDQGLDLGL